MTIETKAPKMQAILESLWKNNQGSLIALAIHDVTDQVEVAWSGARTQMSDEVGLAVTDLFSGPGITRVCEGFQKIKGTCPMMMRIPFEIGDEHGNKLEHVTIRLEYGSRFVLTLLFRPGQSLGVRNAIERESLKDLRSAISESASNAGIRIR